MGTACDMAAKGGKTNTFVGSPYWYGMVWYGMVWYGMVWYDIPRSTIFILFYVILRNTKTDLALYLFFRIAPEVIMAMENGTYRLSADIWSLGITLIGLFSLVWV